MNYFKIVPDLVLSTPSSVDGSATTTVKNIFRSIRFRSDMKRYIQYYEEYVIKDNEKPSDVAYQFYDNPNYDWIILLFNNIKDVDNEWPLSTQRVNELINKKYSNPYGVHHYETKKIEFNGIEILPEGLIVKSDFNFMSPAQMTGYQFSGTIEEDSSVIYINGSAEIISQGPRVFKDAYAGAPLNVSPSIFPDGTEIVEVRRNIDNTYYVVVSNNALVTSSIPIQFGSTKFGPINLKGEKVIKTVYNYDYEMEKNDNKRKISILEPSLILTVEEEFRNKLSYQELTEYAPEGQEYTLEQKINSFY